eukprot:5063927-Prymnesium_polylepis.1
MSAIVTGFSTVRKRLRTTPKARRRAPSPTKNSAQLSAAARRSTAWIRSWRPRQLPSSTRHLRVCFDDDASLQAELKSGIVLSQLANAVKPGVCKKPSTMSAPFKRMVGEHLELPRGLRQAWCAEARPIPDGRALREQGHDAGAHQPAASVAGAWPRGAAHARLQRAAIPHSARGRPRRMCASSEHRRLLARSRLVTPGTPCDPL